MAKTVKGLLEHCREAVKNNVQYIYGAKMQIMTYNQIKQLQKIYGTNCVWNSDLNKAGKLCCDCSGLISSYTGITRGSSQYKSTAKEIVTISQVKNNWKKYIGWAFWMKGHIGVVSDKEGYYYAMDGSARNMVHYPISKQKWTCAIKIVDVDYNVPNITTTNTITGITTANLNVRKYANANCDIFGIIPKNNSVNIIRVYTKDWYEINYNGAIRYVNSNYVSVPSSIYNIKTAINKLAEYGCITTKDYWLNHYTDLEYLDRLLINMSLFVKDKATSNNVATYTQAIEILVTKGVINTPAYWLSNFNKVKYLKELVMNAANALS